jgi:OOP family OmpA-OmpF porin
MDANCHIIEQTVVLRTVDFQFNSVRLTAPAQRTLDDVAAALSKQPTLLVEIQGYADSLGADGYNQRLSQLRADAVKSYLISKDVRGDSLTARGFGKANPVASNSTAEGRAQNRRVAFVVTNAPEHVQVEAPQATPASTEAAKQGGEHPGNVPKH